MTGINYLSLRELEAGLEHIRQSPKDHGVLELIVRRPRVTSGSPDRGRARLAARTRGLTPGVSDRAAHCGPSGPSRHAAEHHARREWSLVAQARERWPLAGDQLYLDLDLSEDEFAARAHDWLLARRSVEITRSLTRAARNSWPALERTP